MQTLNFIIEGQTLKKGKNFPEIVEKSKDFLVLSVENIPSGYEAAAFFSLSWENDTVYNQVIANGECIIPEYCTTLPEIVSDYVDYKLGISIAGVNGAGKRFTTNVVEVVLDKTLYRSETTNTPEIPDSQFDEMLENVANIVEPLKKVENVQTFNPQFVNDDIILIVPTVDYLYGGKPSQSQFANLYATETTDGKKYISVKNYLWGGTSAPDYGVIGDTLNPEGYTSVASVVCAEGVWLPESFEMLPIDVSSAVGVLREEIETAKNEAVSEAGKHSWRSVYTYNGGNPVTPTAIDEDGTITLANHGFAKNRVIALDATDGGKLPDELANIVNNFPALDDIHNKAFVYVTDVTTNTFKIAKSYNGTALTFTNAEIGFKVYPQMPNHTAPAGSIGGLKNEENIKYTLTLEGAFMVNGSSGSLYFKYFPNTNLYGFYNNSNLGTDKAINFRAGASSSSASNPMQLVSMKMIFVPLGNGMWSVEQISSNVVCPVIQSLGTINNLSTRGFVVYGSKSNIFRLSTFYTLGFIPLNGSKFTIEGEYIYDV